MGTKPHTAYDDVFRTLLNDCSSLIIPVINELFGEHYSGDEEIVFSPNEHFMNRQDGKEGKRITDTCFEILGIESKQYHMECQSRPDNSLSVRIFEYGTQIALDKGEIDGNILTVTFPHSAVLFLRSNSSTPDNMKIRMVTLGGELSYDIPVMKMQTYTLDEIFDKNLLFLIPFYIFTHESQFEAYENDEMKLEIIKQEYEEIKERLENLVIVGKISEYTRRTILEMSSKVLVHIADGYESVKKGVKPIMVGEVLDYEAKRILQQGRNDGLRQGREEGIKKMVSSLKKFGVSSENILEQIQEEYQLSVKEAQKYL